MTKIHLPRVVGVHGVARSGKDTIGEGLAKHGYERVSFADPMRRALYKMDMIIGADTKGRLWRLAEVVDDIGWDDAKTAMDSEPRRLLQVFGTEVGRDMFGENFWVDQALKIVNARPEQRFVFTDVRFENEVEAVRNLPDSYLLKVERPGVVSINGHSSDRSLPNHLFDSSVMNDDTIEYLHATVLDHLRWVHG